MGGFSPVDVELELEHHGGLASGVVGGVEEEHQAELDRIAGKQATVGWGSQIRSYVLQPYRLVKDVRTGYATANTDRVLDGDILPFMESWLAQRSGRTEGPVGDLSDID